MTNRLVTPKDLRGHSLESQIEILDSKLGLGLENIELIQSKNPRDTIIEAAELIYTSLRGKGYSKNIALQHISGSIIAPLVKISEDYNIAREEVQNYIWRMFKKEVKEFEAEHGVTLNAPSMLRSKIYSFIEGEELTSNIVETKKRWGSRIEFSDNDLLKGTKIRPIDINHAILLGISTLGLSLHADISKSHYEIQYTIGQEQEQALFQEIAIPIMQRQFNVLTNGDAPKYDNRRIRSNSILLHSYFKHALMFSDTLYHRRLINFSKIPKAALEADVKDLQKAYFIGLLAKKLRTSQQGSSAKFWQGDINLNQNPYLLGQIKELAESYGIQATLGKATGRLKFGKEVFPRLLEDNFLAKQESKFNHKGLIINPYQLSKI